MITQYCQINNFAGTDGDPGFFAGLIRVPIRESGDAGQSGNYRSASHLFLRCVRPGGTNNYPPAAPTSDQ
jgi:hypothetical protein